MKPSTKLIFAYGTYVGVLAALGGTGRLDDGRGHVGLMTLAHAAWGATAKRLGVGPKTFGLLVLTNALGEATVREYRPDLLPPEGGINGALDTIALFSAYGFTPPPKG